MIFNSPTVQRYILSGANVVATIRKSGYYKLGQKVIIKVEDKRFYGKVIAIAPLTLQSLSNYVNFSGFNSVEKWLNEARKLHGAKIDPNKYEIIIVEMMHRD